jgi:PncC family amidohydrolase
MSGHDDLARAVLVAARARGWMVAMAESCTGGLIAAALTEIAGSSDVVDRGFVTYSNDAKIRMLGVPEALIAAHGAVSAEVAAAMAQGALDRSLAQLAVAVTGIAGPGGATPTKCPDAAKPACQTAGATTGQCFECTAANETLCTGVKPRCDTAAGTCAQSCQGMGSCGRWSEPGAVPTGLDKAPTPPAID